MIYLTQDNCSDSLTYQVDMTKNYTKEVHHET